ncbi:hypothetical protein HMPREF1012_03979 [Bacillus sp. BT1B_CT2]|nr:hypothetical protein HMPREF1012_03979 [Bacillus sp. BT1B_CT2]TWM24334.1 hypothetical protein CHCC15075_4183 [Bacillus licheniformis]TWN05294.1 hypothetical protein CHCC14596_0079 [Bacillus licheniformis]
MASRLKTALLHYTSLSSPSLLFFQYFFAQKSAEAKAPAESDFYSQVISLSLNAYEVS